MYLPWQERVFERVSPNKGKQLFMAVTTLVIRLCACVRYLPSRGFVFGTRVQLALTFVSVRVKPEQNNIFSTRTGPSCGKVLRLECCTLPASRDYGRQHEQSQ